MKYWIKNFLLCLTHPTFIIRDDSTDPNIDALFKYILKHKHECKYSLDPYNLSVELIHPTLKKPVKIEIWITNRFYAFGSINRITIDEERKNYNSSKLPSRVMAIKFWDELVKPLIDKKERLNKDVDDCLGGFKNAL